MSGDPRKDTLSIEQELVGERAATLGRMSRRLEAALAALARFDAEGGTEPERLVERNRLRDEARQTLWYLVIQREALGLHGVEPIVRLYDVPAEVWTRMGPMLRGREARGGRP